MNINELQLTLSFWNARRIPLLHVLYDRLHGLTGSHPRLPLAIHKVGMYLSIHWWSCQTLLLANFNYTEQYRLRRKDNLIIIIRT